MVDEAQKALEEAEALKKVSNFLLRIYNRETFLVSVSTEFPSHGCRVAIHGVRQLALVC